MNERRFNRRFVHSQRKIGNFIEIDSDFNVLKKIVEKPIIENFESGDAELKKVKERVSQTEFVGPIVERVMTIDQARTVLHLIDVLGKFELNKVVGIRASRGRGNLAAALGLSLAYAVAKGYSNIFVTSPAPSNVATLFQFILKGFDALKWNEEMDYEVISNNQRSSGLMCGRRTGRRFVSLRRKIMRSWVSAKFSRLMRLPRFHCRLSGS